MPEFGLCMAFLLSLLYILFNNMLINLNILSEILLNFGAMILQSKIILYETLKSFVAMIFPREKSYNSKAKLSKL